VTSQHANWISIVALAVSACATLPPGRSESSLYVDVRKAVELREGTEWVVDRLEVEAVAPAAMRSACQVDAAARGRLLAWLQTQIAIEAGGGGAEALSPLNGYTRWWSTPTTTQANVLFG